MLDSKSAFGLERAEQIEQPRTVLVEHRPVVHDASTDCFAHGTRDGCHCWAECTCGVRVLLPRQVATFTFNHSEPGPMVHRV